MFLAGMLNAQTGTFTCTNTQNNTTSTVKISKVTGTNFYQWEVWNETENAWEVWSTTGKANIGGGWIFPMSSGAALTMTPAAQGSTYDYDWIDTTGSGGTLD